MSNPHDRLINDWVVQRDRIPEDTCRPIEQAYGGERKGRPQWIPQGPAAREPVEEVLPCGEKRDDACDNQRGGHGQLQQGNLRLKPTSVSSSASFALSSSMCPSTFVPPSAGYALRSSNSSTRTHRQRSRV